MPVRILDRDDFDDALRLYRVLTRDPVPVSDNRAAFDAILQHSGTCIIGMEQDGQIIAMVTLHLIPNMTSGGRPYALIENVVTDTAHRGRGIGRAVMQNALDRARTEGAYKVMLLTGDARGAVGFYEKMGFSGHEKHGLVVRF
ncbi:GNAT family N-acetyltransferase [Sulfitobacter sp. S223]|uniref:GNAT family N-acetyltransferase n=1 Tax=Sulfitobacter sp. S223 TaxID=2867023 RepID=UPI0021A3C960|nr:GNAT family N-acetyltransferase [Sulfitobacter sp. S223]UWR26224.1 GNAT family N-acetyltransferase [Sulfitobacter sp. S223]